MLWFYVENDVHLDEWAGRVFIWGFFFTFFDQHSELFVGRGRSRVTHGTNSTDLRCSHVDPFFPSILLLIFCSDVMYIKQI